MRRTAILLIAGVLCGVWGLNAGTATADACEKKLNDTSTALTCKSELGWSYDPASRTFGFGSVLASAKANDPYEYTEIKACPANKPGGDTQADCAGASSCPEKLDSDGKPMQSNRIQAFRKLKANPKDPWQPTDASVCKYTGIAVPISDVLAVGERMKERVHEPKIIAQPPGGVTLVNFTSLFHAPVQNDVTLTITKPVAGLITATPHYAWDLGDGITAEGEGHPYTDLMDPKSQDSDGYYVKAFYLKHGVKNVHLTVTWEVSIKLDRSGVVPLAPIVFTADATTTAKTSHARLVGP